MTAFTFPIVGIGASAGGLEALKKFLKNLPEDTGMGFVFIQHLSLDHSSSVEEILKKFTRLALHTVHKEIHVKPNQIYLISNESDLVIENGILKPIPRTSPELLHLPINQFFNSLAKDLGDRSIGIILSGSGSDGTEGMIAIENVGGITLIQDPVTAQYDSMPRAVLNKINVDFVLPPEKMADELAKITQDFSQSRGPSGVSQDQKEFTEIFELLKLEYKVDFSDYKSPTLNRRIKRRLFFCKIKTVKQYIEYLRHHAEELRTLYQDLTINVTQFFRDPEIFELLKAEVFPKLIDNRPPASPIRIWVPGCSSGEEAYSLAICLFEVMGEKAGQIPIQIFATDISESALEKGRKGFYPESISTDVSAERLKRFFTKTEKGYLIHKRIREACLFPRHDMIKDPPFSRMDLISCRNVLIYMNPTLQKKMIDVFAYVLNPGGFLLLGPSETISNSQGAFSTVNKKFKLHVRTEGSKRLPLQGHFSRTEYEQSDFVKPKQLLSATLPFNFKSEMDRIFLEKFGHSGVLINETLEIVHIYGNISAFVSFSSGEATLNLAKMVHKDLMLELRSLIYNAKKTKAAVRREGVLFKDQGKTKTIDLDIVPFLGPAKEYYYSIFFTEVPSSLNAKPVSIVKSKKLNIPSKKEITEQFAHLTAELASTKKHLESIIEEQDRSNEALQSVNEEITSSNEELQSANEELETAQEELQSSNEELRTLNEELNFRSSELDLLSGDLNNILISITIPILIIGGDFKIRRFTPAAQKLFNVISGDIGRPFINIKHNLNIPKLEELIAYTIHATEPTELDVQDQDGRWYSLKIRPYKTPDNRIDGAVLVLIDIQAAKILLYEATSARKIAEKKQIISETAQEKAETITKSLEEERDIRTQFVSTLSHDLRTPLTAAKLGVDLIARKSMDEGVQKLCKRISTSVVRADHMITDLLDVGRIRSGHKLSLHLENCDFDELVSSTLETVTSVYGNHFLFKKQGMIQGYWDASSLQRVIENLCSNAVKYGARERPITVSLIDKNTEVELSVHNEGNPIPAEEQATLFNLFHRTESAESSGKMGWGIGLTLVKGVVEAHGGSVGVQSSLDVGTIFKITIPKDSICPSVGQIE